MPSGYSWFRLWHEIIFDPKIRKLTTEQRWFWITCLCVASMSKHRGTIEGYDPNDLKEAAGFAFEDEFDAVQALKVLCKFKMLQKVRSKWLIKNWLAWQYDNPSDHPEAVRERVQRYRMKRQRNDNETPTVTTRNDTDKIRLDRVDKIREEKIRVETDGKRETERETQSNPFLSSQQDRERKEIQAKLKKLGH